MSAVTKQEAQRLLCAIFPTRSEKIATRLMILCYGVQEDGLLGWIGDRLDDWKCWHSNRRADRITRKAEGED